METETNVTETITADPMGVDRNPYSIPCTGSMGVDRNPYSIPCRDPYSTPYKIYWSPDPLSITWNPESQRRAECITFSFRVSIAYGGVWTSN